MFIKRDLSDKELDLKIIHNAALILLVPIVGVSVLSELKSCSQGRFHAGCRIQTKDAISVQVYTRDFHALFPFLSAVSFVCFCVFSIRYGFLLFKM